MQRPLIDAVLLGGLSQRFGRPNATAKWRGRTLAEHVLAALPESVGTTVMLWYLCGKDVASRCVPCIMLMPSLVWRWLSNRESIHFKVL